MDSVKGTNGTEGIYTIRTMEQKYSENLLGNLEFVQKRISSYLEFVQNRFRFCTKKVVEVISNFK